MVTFAEMLVAWQAKSSENLNLLRSHHFSSSYTYILLHLCARTPVFIAWASQFSLLSRGRVSLQELENARADEALIKSSRETEQTRLTEQKQALETQVTEQRKREAAHTARTSAFDREEQGKKEDLIRREEELERREREFQSTRTSGEADLEQRMRDLNDRFNDVYLREIAVTDSEAKVQQAKSRNDSEGRNLRSALSILHSLANATGSGYDAVPTLDNIQSLATSVERRYVTMQDRAMEKERSLTDQQEHLHRVEARLESTIQESGTLRIIHEGEMEKFNSLKQKTIKRGATAEEFANVRKKLENKTTEHAGLLGKYATLEAYHESYSGQLEQLTEAHKAAQAQVSELQSSTVPGLQAVKEQLEVQVTELKQEKEVLITGRDASNMEARQFGTKRQELEAKAEQLQSQVTELKQAKRVLTISRDASNVEARQIKVEKQQLETRVRELQSDVSTAEDSRRRMRHTFDTLLRKRDTDANFNNESHRRSLQGFEEVKAINDTLTGSLLDSNNKIKAASENVNKLESKNSELKLQISNAKALERENIRGLELAAEENKTRITDLESQRSKKDATITRLVDESKLAASNAGQRIANLKSEAERKDSEIQTLSKGRQFLESDITQKDSQIRTLTEGRQSLESIIKEKDSEIQGLTEGRQFLQETEIKEKDSKIQEKDSQIQEKDFGIQDLNEGRQSLESTIEQRDSEIRERDSDIQGFNEAHQSLESSIEQRDSEIQAKDSEIRERDFEIQDLNEVRSILESSIEQKDSEIQAKDSEIRERDSKIQDLNEARSILESSIEQQDSEIQASNEARRSLEFNNVRKDFQILTLNRDRKSLDTAINQRNTRIHALGRKVEDQSTLLKQSEQSKKSMQDVANKYSTEAASTKKKLTEAQATIKSLKAKADESDLLLRNNVELQSTVDKCILEHSNVDQTIANLQDTYETLEEERDELSEANHRLFEERDSLGKEMADISRHRDSLLNTLKRLTAQLQSCHCSDRRSSYKRPHDQVDSEEDASTDGAERLARRKGKAPESAVEIPAMAARGRMSSIASTDQSGIISGEDDEEEEASSTHHTRPLARNLRKTPDSTVDIPITAAGSDSSRPTPANEPGYVPGATWMVSAVRRESFTADPIPREVLDKLRSQIRAWDDKSLAWEGKIFPAGEHKCGARISRKKATIWDDGDRYACRTCTRTKAICVGLNNHEIEILPVYRGENEGDLGPDNVKYWVLE